MTGAYSKGALWGEALIRRFTALENCYGNLNKLVEAGLASSSSSNTALLSFELAFLPIYNKSNIVNEPWNTCIIYI